MNNQTLTLAGVALAAVLVIAAACDSGTADAEAASTSAAAAPQRGPLPPAVARLLGQWRASVLQDACTGPGFVASGAPAITHTADFNADGQMDYVFGVGGLECRMDGQPMMSLFEPYVPGGLALSTSEGYRLEPFEYTSNQDVRLETVDGRPALILSDAGPGAYERPFYHYAWGWTGTAMDALAFYDAEARRVNEDGSPWRAGGAAAPAAAAASQSRFLPLRTGYYAPGGDCGVDPFHLKYLDVDAVRHSDLTHNGCRYVRTRALGNGMYETTESCPSEEGGDAPMIGVWKVSGNGFLYDGAYGEPAQFCPLERVPAASRFME